MGNDRADTEATRSGRAGLVDTTWSLAFVAIGGVAQVDELIVLHKTGEAGCLSPVVAATVRCSKDFADETYSFTGMLRMYSPVVPFDRVMVAFLTKLDQGDAAPGRAFPYDGGESPDVATRKRADVGAR